MEVWYATGLVGCDGARTTARIAIVEPADNSRSLVDAQFVCDRAADCWRPVGLDRIFSELQVPMRRPVSFGFADANAFPRQYPFYSVLYDARATVVKTLGGGDPDRMGLVTVHEQVPWPLYGSLALLKWSGSQHASPVSIHCCDPVLAEFDVLQHQSEVDAMRKAVDAA